MHVYMLLSAIGKNDPMKCPKCDNFYKYKGEVCLEEEQIPFGVVRDFDRIDLGDQGVVPMFACEKCEGEMYPEYYKGLYGIEYRILDRLYPKE